MWLDKSSWLKVSVAISLFVLISFLFVNNTIGQENLAEKAKTLMEKEEFQKAYDLLLEEYPGKQGDNQTLFLKGMAAYRLKRFEKATDYFKAILARNPDLPRVRLELARAYAAQGKREKAKKHFKRVLEMQPPPQVRKNIESFLAMLEEEKNWDLNLAVGYLYDDKMSMPVPRQIQSSYSGYLLNWSQK